MKPASIVLALLALGWSARPAMSADLTKIDRTIFKEPKYTSQPHYALLVYGPEAKTRIWLVLDGQVLYLDRNGNGDLTEANERIELDVVASKKTPGESVFNIGEIAGVRLRLHSKDTLQREREESDVARPRPLTDEQRELLRKYREDHKKNGWQSATLIRISEDGSQMENVAVFFPETEGRSDFPSQRTAYVYREISSDGNRWTAQAGCGGTFCRLRRHARSRNPQLSAFTNLCAVDGQGQGKGRCFVPQPGAREGYSRDH
jgi:hypothetical protein